MYFDKAGAHNTGAVLEVAHKAAADYGIKHVVVASTAGETGVKAAEKFAGSGVKVVVVGHNHGFGRGGEWEFDAEKKKRIEELGGTVYTGTMPLRGLGTAIRQRCGNYSEETIVADTLRMLGQGIKVCVEIAAMAADAGLVPCGDVVCVAGTGRGADTCAVLRADSSNRFFDIKVREIAAKPRDF
jgi:uncharacterized protein